MGCRGWSLLLGFVALACSEEPLTPNGSSGPGDMGPGDMEPMDGTPPPEAPRPPVLTPCPEGWEEVTDAEGLTTCDPWPNGGPVQWDCPEGWTQVVDPEAPDLTTCDPKPDSEETGMEWDPVQWECPEGWHDVVDEDGSHTCDPYGPEGLALPDACASPWEAHFPGEPGCTPIGTPCPDGPFAEDLPTDVPIVYVQPGATGDGSSPSSPLGSLDDVPFDSLRLDAVVALAKGEHLGRRTLGRSVTLWGACPAETVLRDPAPTTDPNQPAVVDVFSSSRVRRATVRLTNLRVGATDSGPSRAWGSAVAGRGTLQLDRVVVEGAEGAGVFAGGTGARVLLESTVVRGTRPLPNGTFGRGLNIQQGAEAQVRRAVVDDNRDVGVFVALDATLLLEDTVVRGTREKASDGTGGRGLNVQDGAEAQVRRAVVDDSREYGVFVHTNGSLLLEDAVVRGTRERALDGAVGRGLNVEQGAEVQVRRAVVDDNRDIGVVVAGDASLLLEDAVVRGTRERALDGAFGQGLNVEQGAEAEVRRAVMDDNREIGVFVDTNGSLLLEDAVVRGTRERASDGNFGRGLNVQDGAEAQVRRAVMDDNRQVGVFVGGTGSSLLLEDAVVRGTREQALDGALGRGLSVQDGATAQVRRAVVDDNREVGVFVSSDGSLILEDAVVRGTRERASDGAFGQGLSVDEGAEAQVRRAVVDDNRDLGIYVLGSDLRLEDAVVTGTRRPVCSEEGTCPLDSRAAHALGAMGTSSVTAERVRLQDSEVCGLWLSDGDDLPGEFRQYAGQVEASLRDGVVSGNRWGLCLQSPEFDLSTVSGDSVLYEDNEIEFERTDFVSPPPAEPVPLTDDGP